MCEALKNKVWAALASNDAENVREVSIDIKNFFATKTNLQMLPQVAELFVEALSNPEIPYFLVSAVLEAVSLDAVEDFVHLSGFIGKIFVCAAQCLSDDFQTESATAAQQFLCKYFDGNSDVCKVLDDVFVGGDLGKLRVAELCRDVIVAKGINEWCAGKIAETALAVHGDGLDMLVQSAVLEFFSEEGKWNDEFCAFDKVVENVCAMVLRQGAQLRFEDSPEMDYALLDGVSMLGRYAKRGPKSAACVLAGVKGEVAELCRKLVSADANYYGWSVYSTVAIDFFTALMSCSAEAFDAFVAVVDSLVEFVSSLSMKVAGLHCTARLLIAFPERMDKVFWSKLDAAAFMESVLIPGLKSSNEEILLACLHFVEGMGHSVVALEALSKNMMVVALTLDRTYSEQNSFSAEMKMRVRKGRYDAVQGLVMHESKAREIFGEPTYAQIAVFLRQGMSYIPPEDPNSAII